MKGNSTKKRQQQNFSKHNPQTNLDKLNFYISKSDRSFPSIQGQNGGDLAGLLKVYFQDDDLVIAYEQTSVLHESYFDQKIKDIQKQFLSQNLESSQRSFIDFVEFWVLRDSELKVHYAEYDKQFESVAKQVTKQYLGETVGKTAGLVLAQEAQKANKTKQQTVSLENNDLSLAQIVKVKVKAKEVKKTREQRLDQVKQRIKVIHDHYSKKLLNVPKTSSFDNLNQFFHTMNLVQFMRYVKQVGILNYKITQAKASEENQFMANTKDETAKIQGMQVQLGKNAKQTEEYKIKELLAKTAKIKKNNVQQKQKKLQKGYLQSFSKLNLNFFQRVFQKHSKQFVLNSEQFSDAILSILKHIYKKEIDSPELYKILHLSQEEQYKVYGKNLGIYFPENKIVFRRPNQNETQLYKNKLPKIKLSGQNLQGISGYGYASHGNLHSLNMSKQNHQHKKFFKNRQQKRQYQMLGKMSLTNLRQFKLSQAQQQKFLRMIGSEQYKPTSYAKIGKNTISKQSAYKDPTQHSYISRVNSGVLDRMDIRINDMMNKIR